MFHCIDYVLGAETMDHKIEEADGYDYVLLEFVNDKGAILSLKRALKGGNISTYSVSLDQIRGDGKIVLPKRSGASMAEDVTSVVLPFAGMRDVDLRKNAKGETQRLSIRTLIPIFLVDEDAIFAVSSPVAGPGGYDITARKRMLSYLLTGFGDTKSTSEEADAVRRTKALAKIELLTELLVPMDEMGTDAEDDAAVGDVDAAVAFLTDELQQYRAMQDRLKSDRADAIKRHQFAEGQVVAIDEMLTRYALLDQRYGSDLDRLDFVAEGSHYFDSLQQERCPLCDQAMSVEHHHSFVEHSSALMIQEAARAEASKILGLRSDLAGTTEALRELRVARCLECDGHKHEVQRLGRELDVQVIPAVVDIKERLAALIRKRLELQARKTARQRAAELRALRGAYSQEANPPKAVAIKWDGIEPRALGLLNLEIETVLKEWAWPGIGRVTFDEKAFDILVDGKARRSHGQGVRAVLHAAFALGLLRYCKSHGKPHPGFVLLDSPLTTFKQRRDGSSVNLDTLVDQSIEAGFWRSLKALSSDSQVIVFDNKEPPADVARGFKYELFAGPDARLGERSGFIPQ